MKSDATTTEITFRPGLRAKEWIRKAEEESGLNPSFAVAALIKQVAIEVLGAKSRTSQEQPAVPTSPEPSKAPAKSPAA